MTSEQAELFDQLTELQQRLCTNVLAGMSQREAYVRAGGKGKTESVIDSSASEILRNPQVKAFMDSMKLQAVSDAIMTREEAMAKLSLIGRTDLKDIVTFQTFETGRDLETGEPVKQTGWFIPDNVLSNPAKLAIISELTAGKDGIKVKTHSQLAAIKQLAEMQGWNAAKKFEHTGKDGGPIMTSHSDFYADDEDDGEEESES